MLEPFVDKIPIWLGLSLALIIAILASIPKIFDIWQKANAYNRWYERKKKRLELLKLHYEISISIVDLQDGSRQVHQAERSGR
ncbi:hypothetical protein BH24DEI2_BH24DEI2_26080 [soil metagenome]